MDLVNSTNIFKQKTEKSINDHSVLLLLLDGLAISSTWSQSALQQTEMPYLDFLFHNYPGALLRVDSNQINICYLTIGSGSKIDKESQQIVSSLSSYLASQNKSQLKIGETERLAALTYFFNGKQEEKNKKEEWQIVSSDSSPEEFANAIAFKNTVKQIIKIIKSKNKTDFICASLPILDLAALSGQFTTVEKAAQILDKNLRLICETAMAHSLTVIISAAKGRAENISKENSESILSKDILNPVPFLIIGPEYQGRSIRSDYSLDTNNLALSSVLGDLSDIAPTILMFMKLTPPSEMTGQSLWENE